MLMKCFYEVVMNKLIFSILFISSVLYAASPQEIYKKLLVANNINSLPLYVTAGDNSTCSLACTNGKYILVTFRLLKLVNNDEELAYVIGHEMAHATYSNEMDADLLGLQYVKKAGYQYCVAAQLMKSFLADKDHPDGAIRYKNTGCR